MPSCRQIRLLRYPDGLPQPNDFELVEAPLPPLPKGTELEVEFLLPDNPWERIKARATVTWVRRKTERYVLPPGMGLVFTDITPEARKKVEELVVALNRATSGRPAVTVLRMTSSPGRT